MYFGDPTPLKLNIETAKQFKDALRQSVAIIGSVALIDNLVQPVCGLFGVLRHAVESVGVRVAKKHPSEDAAFACSTSCIDPTKREVDEASYPNTQVFAESGHARRVVQLCSAFISPSSLRTVHLKAELADGISLSEPAHGVSVASLSVLSELLELFLPCELVQLRRGDVIVDGAALDEMLDGG